MPIPKSYFVFDVESVGLHGEGFAVGFLVVDREGNLLDSGAFACHAAAARGSQQGHQWCADHVPMLPITHDAPWLVRAAFWRRWMAWAPKEAQMVADCAWPVEARFLIDCVNDHPIEREWSGPYPLLDVSSVLLAIGLDPLVARERRENELPEHNPLNDARQSARLLLEAIKQTDGVIIIPAAKEDTAHHANLRRIAQRH